MSNIKFPDKHYLGYRPEYNSKFIDGVTSKTFTHYTGFLTPYGTDAQAKKRMSTVDEWVKSGSRSAVYENGRFSHHEVFVESKPSEIFDNIAMSGFTIEQRLNRGGSWSGSQDKWKIDDPRGFQLEITGGNLQMIIAHCTIIEGVIQGECIWAREGAINVLVPTTSELYKTATKNTEISKKSVKLKDLKVGDLVTLQNGAMGTYQGQFYVFEKDYSTHTSYGCVWSKKKKYVFRVSDTEYFYVATPKLSSIDGVGKYLTDYQINEELIAASEGERYIYALRGSNSSGVAVSSVLTELEFHFSAVDTYVTASNLKYDYIYRRMGDNQYVEGSIEHKTKFHGCRIREYVSGKVVDGRLNYDVYQDQETSSYYTSTCVRRYPNFTFDTNLYFCDMTFKTENGVTSIKI